MQRLFEYRLATESDPGNLDALNDLMADGWCFQATLANHLQMTVSGVGVGFAVLLLEREADVVPITKARNSK